MVSMKFTDLEAAETVVMDNSVAAVDEEVRDIEEVGVVDSAGMEVAIVDEDEVDLVEEEPLVVDALTNPRSLRHQETLSYVVKETKFVRHL